MKDREKEIRYLIYLKSEILKQTKKDLKNLRNELETLNNKGVQKSKKFRKGN
mgnify:CR=1 FL=1